MEHHQLLVSLAATLHVPTAGDRVYNDECIYSFDSPFTDTGLYISLHTFEGVGFKYLQHHSKKTGSILYLHSNWSQLKIAAEGGENDIEEEFILQTPQKLGIGIEGGFSSHQSKFDVVKDYHLVLVKEGKLSEAIHLTDKSLPVPILDLCQGIIDHSGMKSRCNENQSWDGDDVKMISKYADNLIQLHNGKRISNDPVTWKCEKSGDTGNLWLNLSTGYIGGGRKNWDGSGGSGAALEHYRETGSKYPLSVKLGTISAHGADVYSYAPEEDDLVLDPYLAEHLSHWGIDIMKLTKTDKSMSDLDVELNMQYDWNKIIEDGSQQLPLSGAGLIGLKNIGSSCYLNSVVQLMCSIPEVVKRYVNSAPQIIASDSTEDVAGDFVVQMSKVASALATDVYAIPPDSLIDPTDSLLEKFSVAPRMFKSVVSKGNREFCSGRQQDASEYFQHLLNVIRRAERCSIGRIIGEDDDKRSTAALFEFYTEKRIQDTNTREVKYIGGTDVNSVQNVLELRIPVDEAVNKIEVGMAQITKKSRIDNLSNAEVDEMKFTVPFEACLDTFINEDNMEMMVNGIPRSVSITTKLTVFPRYLMIKLGRYMVDSNWKQVKIDAKVDMPLSLDLSHLIATGPQAHEVLMSESGDSSSDSLTTPVADEAIVNQLIQMGLEQNGCIRAVLAVENASVELAMEWYFSHMDDPYFHEPPVVKKSSSGNDYVEIVNPESISLLTNMGFSEKHVREALRSTNENVERAADWLFSHPENESLEDSCTSPNNGSHSTQESTHGRYELHAIISHIGKNTESGHYVCHIKKGDQWILYNDEKVSLSQNVPMDCGFMYLYRRCDP